MRFASLFAGIGGLDLGLERAGLSVAWQCEADPYCRAVLRKHWPNVACYEDVRDVGADAARVDLICGGFPCQPVSKAGRRRAQDDERWLWPHFARIIGDLRPSYVIVENVPGLLTAAGGDAMGEVLGDLAALGFDADWESLPASAVGAPHLRDRVFIVAYPHPNGFGLDEEGRAPSILHPREPEPRGESRELRGMVADADGSRLQGLVGVSSSGTELLSRQSSRGGTLAYPDEPRSRLVRPESTRGAESEQLARWWEVEPSVGRVADGIPSRVDRLRCLGNAVVPQVAEWIGRRLMEVHVQSDGTVDG